MVFATNLPDTLESEFVRPLTRDNYHCAIEASCLVPLAMGPPLSPERVSPLATYPDDRQAVFADGGFSLKMPMAIFEGDDRFRAVAQWVATPRTIIFCCDPNGRLWETSMRLRALNDHPSVTQAVADGRLVIIYPDHEIEAGFLCFDPTVIMRTFDRGREQGRRLLETAAVRRALTA